MELYYTLYPFQPIFLFLNHIQSLKSKTLSQILFGKASFVSYFLIFRVDPKLANESITINNIRIFNLTGQEIPVYMVFNNQIDISHLTAGYYIIQVETDTETIQKKLVVF